MLREGTAGAADGDIIALSPPLIVDRPQIDEIFGRLSEVMKSFKNQEALNRRAAESGCLRDEWLLAPPDRKRRPLPAVRPFSISNASTSTERAVRINSTLWIAAARCFTTANAITKHT